MTPIDPTSEDWSIQILSPIGSGQGGSLGCTSSEEIVASREGLVLGEGIEWEPMGLLEVEDRFDDGVRLHR